MPDSLVPLVVTSGLGFGVIAGVVSGICYVFIQGIRTNKHGALRRKYAVTNPYQCCICGAHFHQLLPSPNIDSNPESNSSQSEYLIPRRFAVCSGCNGRACRPTCGQWVPEKSEWLCKQCVLSELQEQVKANKKTGKGKTWFRGILTAFQSDAATVRMSDSCRDSLSTASVISTTENETNAQYDPQPSCSNTTSDEKEIVRDFIERLVGAMLGANLDDTSVRRLYTDTEYDAIFDRYHNDISFALTELGSALHISIANLPISGQTPCTAHASLKNIIRRVLRDASNMAILKEPTNSETQLPQETTSRTYEDLLATAILNKVIDNYQNELRRSSAGSASSKSSSKKPSKNKYRDENYWRTSIENPEDTTSISSVEEWCRSESSCGSKYVDHMSFTIKQSIEEATTSDDENEIPPSNNHYLHSHHLPRDSTTIEKEEWQDNWLFSRKGKGSPKPVPVPMLVPNPSTDYRALIGDRDAEDTTDLSETGSDLDETESVQDIKTILVESRTIIGGKNLLENLSVESYDEPDTQTPISEEINDRDIDSKIEIKIVQSDPIEEASKDSGVDEDLISEARNSTLLNDAPYVESDSLSSNTEKDMEYTEKYASIPRQISKEKKIISSTNPSPTKDIATQEQKEEIEDINEEPPINLRGSYSEKEREKWRNPVALSNNPYSKENLDKRLQNKTNNNGNHSFGRDYYIREAKRAAGGRKKFLDEDDSITTTTTESSGHDFDQESLSLTTSEDSNIYIALPAIIQEEPDQNDQELNRPNSLALSTDSEDMDLKRVYNIETGKIITYKNTDFTKEVINDSKSPEGFKNLVSANVLVSSYLQSDKFDENQNNSKETNREPIMNISKLNHILTPKKEFLMTQLSTEEINNVTTPLISLQEFDSLTNKDEENSTLNLIDIQIEDTTDQEFNHKSCIDLRFIEKNSLLNSQKTNGFANSTPNLNDENIYKTETTNPEIDELITLSKPSVRDLKKIFDSDENKPSKVTISRSTSNLTTKPELKAHRQVHSLTARNLSKEFRKELKQKPEENPNDSSTKSVIQEEVDSVNELHTIPTCQSKIAFFETLKNK